MSGTEGVAIVVGAVLLDLAFGDPRRLPHPVVAIGRLIAALEKILRRAVPHERAGGVILLVVTVALTAGAAAALVHGAAILHPAAGFAVSLYLAFASLAARSLADESGVVAGALERGDLPEARRLLGYIVGRDTARLHAPEMWRATIETVAENTSDGVIAPLLFLMVGGPVAALAYKAVNTLDSMVGYRNDRYLRFGWASARCDDLLNWLPARLTGILMVAAAPLLRLPAGEAWRIMRRDGRNHSSPNSGIPEAAAAGAVGVKLGGTNLYGGIPVEKPTIGDGGNETDAAAYRNVVRLMYGAEGLLLTLWLLARLLLGGVP